MDDGVRDLGLGRMQPRESMVGYAGGQEIGRAVRHVYEVGGVDGTGKRRDAWSRQGNGLDVIRHDLTSSGRVGGGLGERMGGMAA